MPGEGMTRRTVLATGALGALATLSAPGTLVNAAESRSDTMHPVVATTAGRVRGQMENGIATFRGIPYAEPPTGTLRFRPPARRQPWDGVRDATRFGLVAPQSTFPFWLTDIVAPKIPQGEDCLNLNVWSPALGRDAKLPVLVWIHGGGFLMGSGADQIYDGAKFARDDVVCVTLNYRLDALGLLYVGSEGAGNFALLDQIAALTWVRENIAAFGGDPDKVTICGESAGGWSVGNILGAPSSRGLFRRAVSMSGAAHHSMPLKRAEWRAETICARLGVSRTDLEGLQALPTQKILEAGMIAQGGNPFGGDTEHFGGPLLSWLAFMPVRETEELPRRAFDAVADGAIADVDLMVGHTLNEGRLFMLERPTVEYVEGFGNDAMVAGAFGQVFGADAGAALATFKANRPGAGPFELISALMSDLHFRMPAMRLADAQSHHNPNTYFYRFSWPAKGYDGVLGPTHAVELPFMWDTLDDELSRLMTGPNPPQKLARDMHAAWVAFAKTGNPNHADIEHWPRHDRTTRPVMDFDTRTGLIANPASDEAALWDGAPYL